MAHQSFSQLEKGEVDLSQMIWQARSRLVFANNSEDADRVAYELARWTFNPKVVKEERYSWRQLVKGFRKEWMETQSRTTNSSSGDTSTESQGDAESQSRHTEHEGTTNGNSKNKSRATGQTNSLSEGITVGRSLANVPIHKTFRELVSRDYESIEDFEVKLGQQIRQLKKGQAFWQEVESDSIPEILVDFVPIEQDAETRARVEELIQRNFQSDVFISSAEADQEAENCRMKLLSGEPMKNEGEVRGLEMRSQDSSNDSSTAGPFTL